MPGQVLPPPIPGATTSYIAGVQQGTYPWSYLGWSGATPAIVAQLGGIQATPDPVTGTVRLVCWWPYTSALQVVRTGPDGVRTAVRGAYPITPSTATLVNYATNPNSVSTAGYVPGTGSPTLSLITRTDSVGGQAVRATIASSGTCEVTVPQSLPGGQQVTVAVDMQFSARPSGCTITLAWNDSTGAALTPTAVNLSANAINASVGQFGRQVVQITPPTGAATCATLKVAATGLPASGKVDLDRWMLVQALTDGTYGDGDSTGGQWTGTAGLSTSILAPVQTAVDGECPLDVACYYTVYAPQLTGGYASTPTITLASNGGAWLTHPASPSTPVACRPYATPTLTRKISQGVFAVLGRNNPVVVSASTRLAPSGSLTFDAASFSERDTLLGLFGDGSAVLLRAPADFGLGQGMWLALGDVTEEPGGRPAWSQSRSLVCPFQVVDSPAGANSLIA
ncbi:hypothetical protein BC739_003143 [Kutzneria viridogrisea]|uniref:Uncharacterized protein n=1 Tax=Kutzneria viridogrisea TaxID=47990 RepID=A0ABR6BH84_9PSEU|nr:hypothetical protein [Kutzneria viridogrisea]